MAPMGGSLTELANIAINEKGVTNKWDYENENTVTKTVRDVQVSPYIASKFNTINGAKSATKLTTAKFHDSDTFEMQNPSTSTRAFGSNRKTQKAISRGGANTALNFHTLENTGALSLKIGAAGADYEPQTGKKHFRQGKHV